METFVQTLPLLEPYKPALVGMAILCLLPLIQSFLSAPFAFVTKEQLPGMPLQGDHSVLSFRVLRTYANSVESLPAFGIALLIAIVACVNSTLVNWLVAIHLAARLAFWFFYYSGIGRVAGGPRTMSYVVGLLSNIVLAIASILALL